MSQHVGAILRAVYVLDVASFSYGEQRRPELLAEALDACRRAEAAILAEISARDAQPPPEAPPVPLPALQVPLRLKHLRADPRPTPPPARRKRA